MFWHESDNFWETGGACVVSSILSRSATGGRTTAGEVLGPVIQLSSSRPFITTVFCKVLGPLISVNTAVKFSAPFTTPFWACPGPPNSWVGCVG